MRRWKWARSNHPPPSATPGPVHIRICSSVPITQPTKVISYKQPLLWHKCFKIVKRFQKSLSVTIWRGLTLKSERKKCFWGKVYIIRLVCGVGRLLCWQCDRDVVKDMEHKSIQYSRATVFLNAPTVHQGLPHIQIANQLQNIKKSLLQNYSWVSVA